MEWEEGFKEIVVSIPENNSLKNIMVPKKKKTFESFPDFHANHVLKYFS